MDAAPASARTRDASSARPALPAHVLPRIALVALVALQIALILAHDAWRDELQAVMLAWHSHSLQALFASLPSEGHPALWYLLLRALSPLGNPLDALKIVQLCVALATIAIVWTRAPFGPWMKLLILASYPLLFEWGTIARSYGLGVTLFFAFLALRRHWVGYLILALMANISAHFLILSGICIVALLVLDRRRSVAGIVVWAVGCLAAIATALPRGPVATAEALPPTLKPKVLSALETISYALVPIDPRFMPPHWTGLDAPVSALVGAVVAIVGWQALARDRRAGALYLLFFAAMFAFGAFVFPNATRHTAMLFVCLVGLEWMLVENAAGPPSILTKAWAAILVPPALWVAAWSFFAPFTPMKAMIAWSKEHGYAGVEWAAYPGTLGVDLAANLDRPYYDPRTNCLAWFQQWNAVTLDPQALDARLLSAASNSGGRLLLLTDRVYDPAEAPDLSLQKTFHADFLMETWRVYAVAAPAAADPAAVPSCE